MNQIENESWWQGNKFKVLVLIVAIIASVALSKITHKSAEEMPKNTVVLSERENYKLLSPVDIGTEGEFPLELHDSSSSTIIPIGPDESLPVVIFTNPESPYIGLSFGTSTQRALKLYSKKLGGAALAQTCHSDGNVVLIKDTVVYPDCTPMPEFTHADVYRASLMQLNILTGEKQALRIANEFESYNPESVILNAQTNTYELRVRKSTFTNEPLPESEGEGQIYTREVFETVILNS